MRKRRKEAPAPDADADADTADVAEDARPDSPRAPRPIDVDDQEYRQDRARDLDGFLFPGHSPASGGWDGPDD